MPVCWGYIVTEWFWDIVLAKTARTWLNPMPVECNGQLPKTAVQHLGNIVADKRTVVAQKKFSHRAFVRCVFY